MTGGFELAATWAGIKPIWSNEIDPYCCNVLRKNFNHEIIEKDIRNIVFNPNGKNNGFTTEPKQGENVPINKGGIRERKAGRNEIWSKSKRSSANELESQKHQLRKIDILTGGFPCQPFSHAGKRKGTDDNRYLWPEYLRLIRELQPSWVIAENVAGLVSMENGRTLEWILADLENENYQTEVYNIPACGVGAWHKRERIWIVCHSKHNGSFRNEKQGGYEKNDTERQQKKQIKAREFKGADKSRNEGGSKSSKEGGQSGKGNNTQDVSDTIIRGQQGQGKPIKSINTTQKGERQATEFINGSRSDFWQFEPNVGRVANGIPRRVDRLKGLGNAIVPQIAYQLFLAIKETALWN